MVESHVQGVKGFTLHWTDIWQQFGIFSRIGYNTRVHSPATHLLVHVQLILTMIFPQITRSQCMTLWCN